MSSPPTPSKRRRTVPELIESGEISAEELVERAREVALRSLTAARRSRSQVSHTLLRRGYPECIVEPLLDRFEAVGLLNDIEFAASVVRSGQADRGLSRLAIAQELRRRGIDDEIASQALAEIGEESESEAARAVARTRLARTRGLETEVRLRRAVGALARKGYPPSLAFEVVQRELVLEDAPQ